MKASVGLALLLISWTLQAQTAKVFNKSLKELRGFAKKDSVSVQAAVNKWWEKRKNRNQVPLTSPDSAAFLYRRASTSSISWVGDFNGWGSKPSPYSGKRIRNTDIWVYTVAFPPTARLDYKVIINGKDWLVDPFNPNVQFSGVGGGVPNSEIRMPGWKQDVTQEPRYASSVPGVRLTPMGSLAAKQITSQSLGYTLAYSVYTPANITDASNLPILYVTDGNEYNDPRLGNMIISLDNLIANGSVKPLRVVFIDARDPANQATNRRMTELSLNETYLKFVTDELIPEVEGSKLVDRTSRGILGTSLGGLNATFFAFKRPDLFGIAAINSPAYWYKPEIFTLVEPSNAPKLNTFISVGTFNDGQAEAKKMMLLFTRLGHTVRYIETAEGHSWGQWSNLVDDLLITLYGK